jgi:hypothetical protein
MEMRLNARLEQPHTASTKTFYLAGMIISVLAVVGTVSILPPELLPIVLALPVGALFFVLALVRLDLALLVAIFLAPAVPTAFGVTLSASMPQITVQRMLLLLLYTGFALQVAVGRAVLRRPRLSWGMWLSLLFYVGASMASALFSAVPLKSVYRILAYLFDNVGLLLVIVFTSRSSQGARFSRKALVVLSISLTFLALAGLIDTLIGLNPAYYLSAARGDAVAPVYRLGIRRGQGFLPHPTALSIIAAQGVILTMLVMSWHKSVAKRVMMGLSILLYMGALIGTVTRTGWLAFIVGIAIWLILARRMRLQVIFVIIGLFGILALVGIGPLLYSAIVSGFDISKQNEVSTLLSRIRWAEIVWKNIHLNRIRLLFGFGPGTVEELTVVWRPVGFAALITTDYLIRLAESGWVGLLSFLSLLYASIRESLRLLRSEKRWLHDIGVFLLAAFIQMAIGSITLPLFAWAQTTYLFWIFLGVLLAIRSAEPTRGKGS